jgi:hypothetical protein
MQDGLIAEQRGRHDMRHFIASSLTLPSRYALHPISSARRIRALFALRLGSTEFATAHHCLP